MIGGTKNIGLNYILKELTTRQHTWLIFKLFWSWDPKHLSPSTFKAQSTQYVSGLQHKIPQYLNILAIFFCFTASIVESLQSTEPEDTPSCGTPMREFGVTLCQPSSCWMLDICKLSLWTLPCLLVSLWNPGYENAEFRPTKPEWLCLYNIFWSPGLVLHLMPIKILPAFHKPKAKMVILSNLGPHHYQTPSKWLTFLSNALRGWNWS